MDELDDYIRWCNEDRIKLSLGGMNPLRCRQSLGLAAQVFGVGKRRHPRMVIYFEQFAHLGFAAFLSTCPFCMSTLRAWQDSPLNWTSLRRPLCGTFFFNLLEVGSFTGYSSSGWVMSAKRDEPPCSEGGSSVGITHVPNCYRRALTSCSLRVYPKAPPRGAGCARATIEAF